MGIFSKAYIHNDNLELVKETVDKFYEIVNEEIDIVEQDYRFFQNDSDTIILAKNYNENWVEITLNNQFTLYFHDELLRRLTKELKSQILLGYYQSTSGQGRLAKFENGELLISIIQSEFGYQEKSALRLVDNWGATRELKEKFSIPKIKEKYSEIDYDAIQNFFKMNGLERDGKSRKEEFYHHIEIKYE